MSTLAPLSIPETEVNRRERERVETIFELFCQVFPQNLPLLRTNEVSDACMYLCKICLKKRDDDVVRY